VTKRITTLKVLTIPKELYLTAEQAKVEQQFSDAWDKTPGNCESNPQPWVDYPDRSPPQPLEARYMCSGCPVLDMCAAYAKVLEPTHGVWAGKLYGSRAEMKEGDDETTKKPSLFS
jgi:hypothetical protein